MLWLSRCSMACAEAQKCFGDAGFTCIPKAAKEPLQERRQEIEGLQRHAIVIAQPRERSQLLHNGRGLMLTSHRLVLLHADVHICKSAVYA